MSDVSIETLRRWSHVLLWVSIILPFLGALAAGARFYVERYEKRLTAGKAAAMQATTEARLRATAEANDQLRDAVAQTKREFFETLTRERARIVTAQATFVVTVFWDTPYHPSGTTAQGADGFRSRQTNNQAYLAFGKGENLLVTLRSTEFQIVGQNNSPATATVYVNLTALGSEVAGDLLAVQSADYIQIYVPDFPKNGRILGGDVDCTFNGNIRLRLQIPQLRMDDDKLFVPAGGELALAPS